MKFKKFFEWVRILLFSAVLIGGCVLGFILSLRPTTSESEGRTLTKFPQFNAESFLSGEYTSQISLWYADTFPFRDLLLDLSGELKGLYGVGDQEFEGYHGEADTLDMNQDFVWEQGAVRSPALHGKPCTAKRGGNHLRRYGDRYLR